MKFEVQGRSKKKVKFLEYLLPSIIKQLNLENSTKSVLITMQVDCEDCGLTIPMNNIGMYFVVLQSSLSMKSLGVTLAHEMVHVRQMAKGILKSGGRGKQIWKGKVYPQSTPYLDRPWELDAYARQEIILRRACEE